MAIFRVECVNRTTGVPYPVLIEAVRPEDAADFCIAQGHLVGRIVRQPEGNTGAGETATAAGAAIGLGSAGAAPALAARPTAGGVGLRAASVAAAAPDAVAAAESTAVLLRAIADDLAALRRSPMIARPRRTIAVAVMLALSAGMAVGFLLSVLLVSAGLLGARATMSSVPGLENLQESIRQLDQIQRDPLGGP